MAESPTNEEVWTRAAKRLIGRIRVGWWLQGVLVPLVLLALVGGGVLVWFRRTRFDAPSVFWWALGVAALAVGVVMWLRSARHSLDLKGAFARLDADLGLYSALSTAFSGQGSWPIPPVKVPAILKWNAGRILAPLGCAVVFLILGGLVPIAPAEVAPPENEPFAWANLEQEVESLLENEVIREEYADELKKKLEELRGQKAEDWFSAASLEATDHLRKAHMNEVAGLERTLMKAEKALKQLAESKLGEAAREEVRKQFEEAMKGLKNGGMKPNEELLKKMAKAADEGMKGMDAEQRKRMEELADQLREQVGDLADAMGGFPQPMPGGPGGKPGDGGPGGNLFGEKGEELEMKKFERLDARDEQEPKPGDLLKIEEIEHDLEKGPQGPRTSGQAQNQGKGGARVWKEQLVPAEQKSLKRFFE